MTWVDIHRSGAERWNGMTKPSRCRTCFAQLPPDSRPTKRYCSVTCQTRASSRRRRGLPEADSAQRGLSEEQVRLVQRRERQLSGKDCTLRRVRASRDVQRQRARAAETELQAERRRAEAAITAAAQDAATASRKCAELAAEADRLRQATAAAEAEAGKRAAQLDTAYGKLRELATVNPLPVEVYRQWVAVAAQLAERDADPSRAPLAGLEHEIVTTWRGHQPPETTTPPPATQTPRSRPARRRPAARPAARPANGINGRSTP